MNYMPTEGEWILRRNCTYAQKVELEAMLTTEATKAKVGASILDRLYRQVNSVRRIDFVEIDKSKGDVKKLPFFDDIDKSLTLLEKEAEKQIQKDVAEVRKAITNLAVLARHFTDGYKLDTDVVILTYESIVMSIVDAVSTLITRTATTVVKTKARTNRISLSILGRFNTAVSKGSVQKMFSQVNNPGSVKEDFGATALATSTIVIAGLAIVPFLREAIFYFYYARMRLSNYLDQIKMYIQINEVEVKNNSNFTEAKKSSIIEKQNKWISTLEDLSDKIRVSQDMGAKAAEKELKKSDSEYTLDNVKTDMSANNGFDFE